MLYTEEITRDNIRTRDGKRVFFLGQGDTLTPGARDFLTRERIEIRSSDTAKIEEYRLLSGGFLREKPEDMTHLQGDILVRKDHPRIVFRGELDSLQGEILLCQGMLPRFRGELGELLALARTILRCEVLEEPLKLEKLCGLTEDELRSHSHRPQDHYGQPHFMPEWSDGEAVLWLNRLRSQVRAAERAAVAAFRDGQGRSAREDILRAMNRMSGMVYILMIRAKKEVAR